MLVHRRGPERPQTVAYTAVGSVNYPLNPSRSKFIVVGLDYERQLAPFVSIENKKGYGPVLTPAEFRKLLLPAWLDIVDEHMTTPAYHVRVMYTQRHEVRCAMADNKPAVQITPINATGRTGYTYLGETSWEALKLLEPLVLRHLEQLEKQSVAMPGVMFKLIGELAFQCGALNYNEPGVIRQNLPSLYKHNKNVDGVDFSDTLLKLELVRLYPDFTTGMVFQALRKGLTDVVVQHSYAQ